MDRPEGDRLGKLIPSERSPLERERLVLMITEKLALFPTQNWKPTSPHIEAINGFTYELRGYSLSLAIPGNPVTFTLEYASPLNVPSDGRIHHESARVHLTATAQNQSGETVRIEYPALRSFSPSQARGRDLLETLDTQIGRTVVQENNHDKAMLEIAIEAYLDQAHPDETPEATS